MLLRIVTPPAAEPVGLDEAKLHLRVDHNADDPLIARLITTARGLVESIQRRALITQTWDLVLDAWPTYDRRFGTAVLDVPLPPCQAVGPITYVGSDSLTSTWATSEYVVALGDRFRPARVWPRVGKSWPALAAGTPEAITVRFTAGYGDLEDVPEVTRQAILLLIGHWYTNREAVLTSGNNPLELPLSVATLLAADSFGSYP